MSNEPKAFNTVDVDCVVGCSATYKPFALSLSFHLEFPGHVPPTVPKHTFLHCGRTLENPKKIQLEHVNSKQKSPRSGIEPTTTLL